MAHQLWASPITGYRRKGTRLAELRSLLGSGITAHAILEPLQSCPADALATEMAEMLRRKEFDVAGVQSQRDGPVIGFVMTETLKGGAVRDYVKPLTADDLMSDSTMLPSVLSVLKGRQRAFVLIGPNVRGIVTRADLNKPPVRVYLFGLISLLEMHLGFWIRAGYGEDGWQDQLNGQRLDEARKLQAKRRERHHEASLAECLQFCDKRDLVLARDDLRGSMGLEPKASACGLLRRAEDLRNVLAHSQQDLAEGTSWQEVIDLVEWVETVVQTSDESVEQKIKESAKLDEDGFWASA